MTQFESRVSEFVRSFPSSAAASEALGGGLSKQAVNKLKHGSCSLGMLVRVVHAMTPGTADRRLALAEELAARLGVSVPSLRQFVVSHGRDPAWARVLAARCVPRPRDADVEAVLGLLAELA